MSAPATDRREPADVPTLVPFTTYRRAIRRALRDAYPDAGRHELVDTAALYLERWHAQFGQLDRGAVVPPAVARSFARRVGTAEAVRALRHTGTDLAATRAADCTAYQAP